LYFLQFFLVLYSSSISGSTQKLWEYSHNDVTDNILTLSSE
jgi:hypothetical protein